MSGILTTLAGHQFHVSGRYESVIGFICNYIISHGITVFERTSPKTAYMENKWHTITTTNNAVPIQMQYAAGAVILA